jgi:hypothetical protein
MANWTGCARSNYFLVKDLEAFRKALADIDVEIVGQSANPNDEIEAGDPVALLSKTDNGDWPTMYYNEATDEQEDIDLFDIVAQHLADDEVTVFVEAGHEKMAYITGYATAINNKGQHRMVSLDHIYDLARELGPNVTEASF